MSIFAAHPFHQDGAVSFRWSLSCILHSDMQARAIVWHPISNRFLLAGPSITLWVNEVCGCYRFGINVEITLLVSRQVSTPCPTRATEACRMLLYGARPSRTPHRWCPTLQTADCLQPVVRMTGSCESGSPATKISPSSLTKSSSLTLSICLIREQSRGLHGATRERQIKGNHINAI